MSHEITFSVQFAACLFLTGLIWLIQLIHYPSFHWIDKNLFPKFHSFHSTKITFIVGPLMSLELLTALALALKNGITWLPNLISVVFIWVATGLVSVPIHNQLASGYNQRLVHRLISTNWIRTALWSLRTLGLFIYMAI